MPRVPRVFGGRATLPSALAFGLACTLLAYRFMHLDAVPFIFDEPHFLSTAREEATTHTWVHVSPIFGTQGMKYGPSVLWFYGALQRIAGPAPLTAIVAITVIVTAAHAWLALTLAEILEGGMALAAAIVAFIASSPYQFFWSRIAWDPLVNVCAAAAVALVVSREVLLVRHGVGLGIICGVALSSHLMCTPLVALVFATLFLQGIRRRRVMPSLAALGVAGLINLPYAHALLSGEAFADKNASTAVATQGGMANMNLPHLLDTFLQPARVATLWKIQYFFDDAWTDFASFNANRSFIYEITTVPFAVAAVALIGLVVATRARSVRVRRVAWLGLATWIGYSGFYAWRGIELHPHYQFPVWWVVPVGVAVAIAAAMKVSRRAGRLALATTWAFAALQFAFIGDWMHYVGDRVGTSGKHYATPLAAQRAAVRQTCKHPGADLVVYNETQLFPESLDYIAAVEPDCHGKTVKFCARNTCTGTLRVHYANPAGGALAVDGL